MAEDTIPDWFRQEHERNNIWQPPFDYGLIARELDALEEGIRNGWKEANVQAYLKSKPHLFDGLYRHGHGTFVFSEMRFGSTYVADWVVGNGHSGGLLWNLIELECPQSPPFMKDGHFSEPTRKGTNQIHDWRDWISKNIAFVQRPKSQHGLGLHDLDGFAHGMVVVGRRALYESSEGVARYNEARNTSRNQNRIEVISYESLIDKMRFHVKRWAAGNAEQSEE